MVSTERIRLTAQERHDAWLRHREKLRCGDVKIFRSGERRSKYQLDFKWVGKPITPEKLEEIFEDLRPKVQTFAFWLLKKRNWRKFAISQTKFRFERDPNMMFFKVGRLLPGEQGVEIIYLGTGRTDKIPEIANQTAAESWGFAILQLSEMEED